jgi:hypothetical protein
VIPTRCARGSLGAAREHHGCEPGESETKSLRGRLWLAVFDPKRSALDALAAALGGIDVVEVYPLREAGS